MAKPSHLSHLLMLVSTLGGLLSGRRVDADETNRLVLEWNAPPECPSPVEVKTKVARLLGDAAAQPGRALSAVAEVTHAQDWSVTITTHHEGHDGRRTLTAASCMDVANATALILALAIDPDAVAAHAQVREEKPATPPPPPDPPPVEPLPPPSKRTTSVLTGLHLNAGQGRLPGWDIGLGGSVGVGGPRWRIALRGTYGLRRDQVAQAPEPPGAYGEFNYLGGALAVCLNLGTLALAVGPCADAELGRISAKGVGASVGFPAHATWLALGAGGYAAIPLGEHLHLPLHVDVLAPLYRPEYIFKDVSGRVYQAPAVGVRMLAGIEAHF